MGDNPSVVISAQTFPLQNKIIFRLTGVKNRKMLFTFGRK